MGRWNERIALYKRSTAHHSNIHPKFVDERSAVGARYFWLHWFETFDWIAELRGVELAISGVKLYGNYWITSIS